MLVLGINKILEWCQITSGGRTYTCPTKYIDGKLFFKFKRVWHPVSDYISEHLPLFYKGVLWFSQAYFLYFSFLR